jgi:hypothetical protein
MNYPDHRVFLPLSRIEELSQIVRGLSDYEPLPGPVIMARHHGPWTYRPAWGYGLTLFYPGKGMGMEYLGIAAGWDKGKTYFATMDPEMLMAAAGVGAVLLIFFIRWLIKK